MAVSGPLSHPPPPRGEERPPARDRLAVELFQEWEPIGRPRARQAPHRLLLLVQNPYRRQLPAARQPRQLAGITPIRLDPFARRLRDPRRRQHRAIETQPLQLTVHLVTVRTRLVTELDQLAVVPSNQLVGQLANRLRLVGQLPQMCGRFPARWDHRHGGESPIGLCLRRGRCHQLARAELRSQRRQSVARVAVSLGHRRDRLRGCKALVRNPYLLFHAPGPPLPSLAPNRHPWRTPTWLAPRGGCPTCMEIRSICGCKSST